MNATSSDIALAYNTAIYINTVKRLTHYAQEGLSVCVTDNHLHPSLTFSSGVGRHTSETLLKGKAQYNEPPST